MTNKEAHEVRQMIIKEFNLSLKVEDMTVELIDHMIYTLKKIYAHNIGKKNIEEKVMNEYIDNLNYARETVIKASIRKTEFLHNLELPNETN